MTKQQFVTDYVLLRRAIGVDTIDSNADLAQQAEALWKDLVRLGYIDADEQG